MRLPPQRLTVSNKIGRTIWGLCWLFLFRPTPVFMHAWRRTLLRVFGAQVANRVHVYPSAKVWAPWNLTMKAGSCLARDVDCYNVAPIVVGERAVVSQYAYLCTASHDHRDKSFPLIASPIVIADMAWVAAGAFIGPGVTVGEGAIVGAMACAFKDIPDWKVAGGNPATVIGERHLRE
jgi:putative colanic acid biosynthesis acetyltransferase WcaF